MATKTLIAVALLAALLASGGCSDEGATQSQRNRAIMPAWVSYDLGAAAEVRSWEDRDGVLWCVIGRYDRFVVFQKPAAAADWKLAYAPDTGRTVPADVKLFLEAPSSSR